MPILTAAHTNSSPMALGLRDGPWSGFICPAVQAYVEKQLGGISRLSFQMNAASLPHGKLMRAIEAIGTRVVPAVRERLADEVGPVQIHAG